LEREEKLSLRGNLSYLPQEGERKDGEMAALVLTGEEKTLF